jgi:SAM-dependent methyltransferase
MQKLMGILKDFKEEGHALRTFRRKVYANLKGHRPERRVYQDFMKPLILNVGTGRDYILGAVNIDNFQLHTYTSHKTTPDLKLDACGVWPKKWRGTFQTVLASHLWEHLHHPHKFFQNAYDALAPGGHLIIIVPNLPYMGEKAYFRDPTHIRRCPSDLMVAIAREGKRWKVVQMNRLGKHYKFSFDIVLEKQ